MPLIKNFILICLLLGWSGQPIQAKEWHVSPHGDATGNGTLAEPFAMPLQARDAIRAYRKENPDSSESHTVILHTGRYPINETLELGDGDGGRQGAPVVYRAKAGAAVTFHGGTGVNTQRFRTMSPTEAGRLMEAAREHVVVAEVEDLSILEALGRGHGRYGMLVENEHTLQLARWPNRGFVHLDEVVDMGPTLRWLTRGEKPPAYSYEKPVGGRFTLLEDANFDAWRAELERTRDVRQGGYLSNDWTEDKNQVARISGDGVIQLLDATRYGIGGVRYRGGFADPSDEPRFLKHRRLYFMNLLCELDMPGEWYFDRNEKKLYLWPISKNLKDTRLTVPGGPALVELSNASHVVIRDIVFENGGRLGLSIDGGSHVTIAGCTFRNFTGKAIEIEGGQNHTVNACTVYNVQSGLTIRGGELRTLKQCNHKVINSEFKRFRGRGYGGIGLMGCGIEFRNNLYHSMNAAIKYEGAYIRFANNEFYNVGWEMGDWNVLYQGADKWCNGNIVENNFFHHMMEEPGRHPIVAVRNDDGGTGTTYRSNLFYKTGRGAIAFGGPNNHILDNIVLETSLLWWTARLPTSDEAIRREYALIAEEFESGRYPRGGKEDAIYNVEQVVGKRGWEKPPWSTAFPAFARYMNENPFAQSYGSMLNNYHNRVDPDRPYGVVHIHKHWALPARDGDEAERPTSMADMPTTFKHNAPMPIDLAATFRDPSKLDFRLKPGVRLQPGFRAIDPSSVGLFESAYRPDPPDPITYRSAIYQRYQSIQSWGGRYDPETAYLRYPQQPWIE